MVAGAGYHGMAIDLGASDVAVAHAVRPHMQRVGLTPLIVAFPKTIESLEDTLLMARDFGAPFVDVIGQVMPLAIDDMVPVIETWMAMGTALVCRCSSIPTATASPTIFTCAATLGPHSGDADWRGPVALCGGPRVLVPLERARHGTDEPHPAAVRQFSRPGCEPAADPAATGLPAASEMGDAVQGLVARGLADWRVRNRGEECIFVCELGRRNTR